MSVLHAKVVKAVIAIDNGQDNSIAAAQRRFREEHPHEKKLSRGQQNSLRKKAKSLCQHRLSSPREYFTVVITLERAALQQRLTAATNWVCRAERSGRRS